MASTAKKPASVAGKRPSDSEISEMLNVEHIGAKKSEIDPAKLDPVRPTPMVVRLEQMETYSDNPRQGENPLFDDLYDRIISQKGLTDVLNITRRPGSDKYILSAGGNTRLSALHKAFNDTNDEAYARFQALFIPYENEAKILISHIAENNQRAGLTFIESALSVIEARRYLEEEHNTNYSQRELVNAFKAEGYTLTRTNMGLYEYAVDNLVKHMPKALYAGMGRPKIQEIKNIESKLRDYTAFKDMDADRFTLLFEQSLTKNDTEEGFMFDHFENDLIILLSEALDLDIGTFEYELDGFIQEGEESYVFKETTGSIDFTASMGTQTGSLSELIDDDPNAANLSAKPSTKPTKTPNKQTPFERIEQLQKQAARHAERLAIAVKITDCLHINNYGIGHGYWMDFPSDERKLDMRQASVWWHLYLCSGLSSKQDHDDDNQGLKQRAQVMGDHIKLKDVLINSPDYTRVFLEKIGHPDQYALTMFYLTDPAVDERLHREFLGLSSTCRELLITANENGLTQELWTKK